MANENLDGILPYDGNERSAAYLWARINAFLDLKAYNTQQTYIGVVKEWCDFLGVEAGSDSAARAILSATDLHAMAYRKWLERQPGQRPRYVSSSNRETSLEKNGVYHARRDGLQSSQANSTIAKKFAALRRIYRMLIGANLGITVNPFDQDRVPAPSARSGQKRPTEMIDFSMVRKILELPDLSTDKGIRDRAALSLMFGGGLRRSEVVSLRLCDVCKSPEGTSFVRLRATKNKKDADQAIPDWAAEWLFKLVNLRAEAGALPADPLFVGFRGPASKDGAFAQLTTNGLYRIFKEYCEKAGAGEYVTPHSARATAITKLLSDGVTHREVQEFSRHSSIQMVEAYDKRRYGVEQNPGKKLSY